MGTPYADFVYKKGAQIIPGRLQCEYYDVGGEGIAYHDNDSTNSGSGHLNPSDGSYLNEFRIANIHLNEGLQTFTIHTVEIGQMNYDFINFQKVN
jgi:hypothetical protein